MKKIVALTVVALGLTACSEAPSEDTIYEVRTVLEDGRSVACLVYKDYRKGGLSCDWGNAK